MANKQKPKRTKKRTTKKRESKVKKNQLDSAISTLADNLRLSGSALLRPSSEAVARLHSIPLIFDTTPVDRQITAHLKIDSWANGPAIGLRDISDGHVRRLRFEAGKCSLEIVAERRQNRWEFVARAYKSEKVSNCFVLKIGRRKILPESGGFYHWSSVSVPRQLSLLSNKNEIIYSELTW